MLRDLLVDHFQYPKPLKHLRFDPTFAIRGLHFGVYGEANICKLLVLLGKCPNHSPVDIENGWLMKIDNFANIQLGTVHGKWMFLLVHPMPMSICFLTAF